MNKRTLTIIALAAGGIFILLAYVYILHNTDLEREKQRDLEPQLTAMSASQEGQESIHAALVTRQVELTTAEAQLAAVQLALPSEVDSTEVLAEVVTTAAIHRVNLSRIVAHAPTTVTLEGLAYRILVYDIAAEGDLAHVAAFLGALESGPIGSMTLDGVQIQVQATPTPNPTLASTMEPPSYRANLSLKIYTRIATPGAGPLPPVATLVSPEKRIQQLETLLTQAQQEQDWEHTISLLVVMRQFQPEKQELDAQLVEAYVQAGQQRLTTGQYEWAGENFRAALALEPENVAAQTGLVQLALLTPTPTATPTQTPTPTPTSTPTITPTATATPLPYYVAHLERSANTRYPSLGCGWFGFYGKITDSGGYPVQGLSVHIWARDWVGITTVTSASGEYELYLDDHPKKETWFLQLHAGGKSISPAISVESHADCGSALIRVDWKRGY